MYNIPDTSQDGQAASLSKSCPVLQVHLLVHDLNTWRIFQTKMLSILPVKLTFKKRLCSIGTQEYVHFRMVKEYDHHHVSYYTFNQVSFYLKTSYSLGINGTKWIC